MYGRRQILVLLVLLTGTLLASPLGAEELSAWYASDPRARGYEEVRDELLELFAAARQEDVPTGPLLDKLREGASKGVEAERLLGAVRDAVDRLVQARSILDEAAGTTAAGPEEVQALSLLLLQGLSDELARELLGSGLQSRRSLPVIRAACTAVASLQAMAESLDDPVALNVGSLLLASRLPASAYGSLVSIYAKARAAGLEEGEILQEVIIGTLAAGGGLVAMDEKINRGQAAKAERQPKVPPGQAKDKDKSKKK